MKPGEIPAFLFGNQDTEISVQLKKTDDAGMQYQQLTKSMKIQTVS